MKCRLRAQNKISIAVILSASFLMYVHLVNAGTLSCTVRASACSGGEIEIFEMQNTTNAHAGLSAASYNNLVCCSGVTGLGTLCSGTFATALKLSSTTNAHAEQNSQSNYVNNACLSVPSGGSVSVAYQSSNCTGYDTTLGSMTGTTNAHVGDGTAYTTKVCATAAGGAASLTFVVSTNVFPSLTPGSPIFATTTLSVDTNNSTGWNVTLSRDDANTTMDLDTDATVNITDQTDWIPGSATTTAGNAVRISSFINSQKVLAFRTMTASGTVSFISTSWWGTTDAYTDSASTLWAGIASSTASNLKIGNSSISSGGSAKLNTVLYYLDVPSTQKTGAYSGGITFTATMNP